MYNLLRFYVLRVDALNRLVGRCVIWLIFLVMGILLFSSLSRYILPKPVIWGTEMAQFVTTAYYMLGGGFALLLNSHARMDVFYSRLTPKKKAAMDSVTVICLIVFLGFLLFGGISSTIYSIEFNQHRNTAWGPAVAPVKIFMTIGVALTLLQAISECIKDVYRARGITITADIPELVLVETNYEEKIRDDKEKPAAKEDVFVLPDMLPDLVPLEVGRV